MTTVMSITTGNSEGSSTRKCDANCHEAEKPTCTCICGGRNHGVGLTKATDNARGMAEAMLERMKQQRPEAGSGLVVGEFDKTTAFPAEVIGQRLAGL